MARSILTKTGAVVVFLTLALAGGVAEAQICDAGALSLALASASSGDVVHVGDCSVVGSFEVPFGVSLRGTSARSTIVAPPNGTALRIVGGSVASLGVVSDGRFGVYTTGSGATLANVEVVATRGVGIAAEDAASVSVDHVAVRGPVSAASASSVPASPSALATATHGMIFVRTTGTIAHVSVRGFAAAGAAFVDSDVELAHSRVAENVGTGVVVSGGVAELDRVDVLETRRGAFAPGETAAGVAIGEGANVTTTRLRSSRNEGLGVFQDGAGIVEHEGLEARLNDAGGVIAQGSEYLALDGAAVSLNGGFGVAVIDTTFASVTNSRVIDTRMGDGFGDGIQIVATAARVEDVFLAANDRIGMLVDYAPGAPTSTVELDGVTVVSTGSAYGVVAQQDGAVLPLLTAGITRHGAAARLDSLVRSILEKTGGVEPPGQLQGATDLGKLGLGSLFGFDPNDPI